MAVSKAGAMAAHRRLVREGHLLAASIIMRGLHSGLIILGASVDAFRAEDELEAGGATFSLGGTGGRRWMDAQTALCRVREVWQHKSEEAS